MADIVKEYAIKISVEGNKAVIKEFKTIDKQVEKGTKTLDKQNKSLNKTNSLLWTYAKRLVGIYGIYKLFNTGLNLVTKFAEQGRAIGNMSNIANMSARSLQKWGYALKMFGGDEKSVASTMGAINQKLNEQKFGQEPFREFIERYYKKGDIGILNSKNAEEFLLNVARKMEGYSKDDKIGIGRSLGLDDGMINFLMQGYEAVAKQLKEAQVLYSDADIQKAREAKKILLEFNTQLERLQVIMAKWLLPAVKRLIKFMENPVEYLKEWYHSTPVGWLYDTEIGLGKKGYEKGKDVVSKTGNYLEKLRQSFTNSASGLLANGGVINNITMYITGSNAEETASKVVEKQNDITTEAQRNSGVIN